jgi:hypothetical protein
MKNRAWIAALALTGCALVAGGCKANDTATPNASGSAGTPAATNATSAANEMMAAVEKLRSTSYKFSVTTGGITMGGIADPVAKTAAMDVATSIEAIVVDGQVYLKYPKGLPGFEAFGGSDKWLHVDASKIDGSKLGVQDPTDPSSGLAYLKTATSVRKVGDKHYKGMLDLTKSPGLLANSKLRSTLGDAAKAVPFDVTLDDEGRLSAMDMTMKINGSEVTTHNTFSDFGTKVTVTKPAPSEVVEAPESIYGVLSA